MGSEWNWFCGHKASFAQFSIHTEDFCCGEYEALALPCKNTWAVGMSCLWSGAWGAWGSAPSVILCVDEILPHLSPLVLAPETPVFQENSCVSVHAGGVWDPVPVQLTWSVYPEQDI